MRSCFSRFTALFRFNNEVSGLALTAGPLGCHWMDYALIE